MELSDNALKVLRRRYLLKDEHSQVTETPEQMFSRVAGYVASADERYRDTAGSEQEFYSVMSNLEFLPNSPTLMNAGTRIKQLAACLVLPIGDSLDEIFGTLKSAAIIHQSGGGTGFSFSKLRPQGDIVGSTGGIASGPVSFMKVFDAATQAIKQGGRRRGANMGILRVDHPDIVDFITAKHEPGVLTNFNLSVGVSDTFMEAVEAGGSYELINPRTGEVTRRKDAIEIFNLIAASAWENGEPGLLFLDTINRDNPTPGQGTIEATNPCGEQPLLPYEACNLGSINLDKMVDGGSIDYDKLGRTVDIAVRFLDNVIDLEQFPLEQIDLMVKGNRKIGLGVMGFADMLIHLGIAYNSTEAVQVAEEVMTFICNRAVQASGEISQRRGVFGNFKSSIYDSPCRPKVRNATRITIAPTGTISMIAGCSSGIEPIYAVSYVKTVMEGEKFVVTNPYFEQMAVQEGFYSPELVERIASNGSVQDIPDVPVAVQRLFVTSHDMGYEWHIRLQAAFQKYADNAVSKTINFRHDATKEDVGRAFRLAYTLGCKGITVYRDRSRSGQVLTTVDDLMQDCEYCGAVLNPT
ncbi:MAG: adenosylcobalamin-dependent ribonucleoside-diphosphate reductase [ANME-2 cluster archaeon]|nr:adenosylcobalamin-dependent ribonucleoside-diphosphate reductase [ANME-2 cluster archaeon]MBC2700281.1 adenosylcobalamin-dependent ribonucleoside-diphosphate reductase [ANME-2 cluster archaeon]MBC2708023.1 adenosylcobalamin-dependent ribonucleoside-diphosphate reductase [ANME-2 cluster archaeon]MBC2747799.1 adenosylcobalamin-dependent ribonucleoside-diphosphate reductase [ANME-2 cluster archaeon]MBC2762314.1 adenosylcobalamin-dependent ribonucleoside-diphosphate reductase [ANME-2 cluster arc